MRPQLRADVLKFNKKVAANQKIVDMVNEAGGIQVSDPVQSDKVGYDWLIYYVNGVEVRRVYVPQHDPIGTASNPIPWDPERVLYPNTFYIYKDVRKVWMGKFGVIADWDDENFVEF